MAARTLYAAFIGLALGLAAVPSAADEAPDALPDTTEVMVVDVGALPKGELPPLPAEKDAPLGVPAWTQPATITVTAINEKPRPRHHKKATLRVTKTSSISKHAPQHAEIVKLVSVAPSAPSIDVLYAPSADATELEAQAAQRMQCGEHDSVLPMRWETLGTTADGDAHLEVHDLWFDAKSCAIGPGPASTLALKAIAWDDGKPWLYAMRSHAGVTLIMPRVTEVSSESMVGTPVSVRGDFTRITMPVGRWGSGSIVAHLDSLTAGSASDGADRPVEVGIELVQTMSEKAPTLLVRTRRANVARADEGKE
jgi:hypothetical protein